jgi:hypothetical protein
MLAEKKHRQGHHYLYLLLQRPHHYKSYVTENIKLVIVFDIIGKVNASVFGQIE